jgi:outer membrane lipoprotein-sorting protein
VPRDDSSSRASGSASRAGSPHPEWQDRAGAYRLRVERRDKQDRPIQLEFVVSRQTSMPLQYSVTRDGKLVTRITFSRFKPNVGKKPGRFRF